MDINFEYYKIFYYVAKYGNITKAAAALGGNQPNVTRMIRLLESQLNTRLLIREPRGIRLTEAGRQLYSHVEIACRHFMEADAITSRSFRDNLFNASSFTQTSLPQTSAHSLHQKGVSHCARFLWCIEYHDHQLLKQPCGLEALCRSRTPPRLPFVLFSAGTNRPACVRRLL